MFDFIEQHKKLFLGLAIGIIIAMLTVLLILNRNQQATTNTNNSITNNEPNYSFLKEDISKEDKYLMLLGKILTEQYGTYSKDDVRGLLDVQNQSTTEYKAAIEKLIESIPAGKNIATEVDAESITLTKESNSMKVQMKAVTTDETGTKKNIQSTVVLVKQGDYWLTSGISFKNQ